MQMMGYSKGGSVDVIGNRNLECLGAPDWCGDTLSLLGELASRYAQKKQFIMGSVFFLSSGAAGTLIGKLPTWVPICLSIGVALLSAYTITVNLDVTIRSMVKFHYAWSELARGYESLWDHVYDEQASQEFELLVRRERDLSELATTGAPNDQARMAYWQEQVFRQHALMSA